jgi:hypothetical protein
MLNSSMRYTNHDWNQSSVRGGKGSMKVYNLEDLAVFDSAASVQLVVDLKLEVEQKPNRWREPRRSDIGGGRCPRKGSVLSTEFKAPGEVGGNARGEYAALS